MVRETVINWKCDECGEAGEDVRTYTVRIDGQGWEIDLDLEHLGTVTLARAMEIGRPLDSGPLRPKATAQYERRIRNRPEEG